MAPIEDYSGRSIGAFVRKNIAGKTKLLTDEWRAYDHLERQGYLRKKDASSQYSRATMRERNPMPHVHLLFSNVKTWLTGRFHGVSSKYLGVYLDEFVYRLNRRFSPPDIFAWICRRMTAHSPVPLNHVRAADSRT